MNLSELKKQYSVVIVGSGLAGLYGALNFPEDIDILMLSKKERHQSNSSLAQGGVAAVVDKDNDDYRLHIADTLIAGGYKNINTGIEYSMILDNPTLETTKENTVKMHAHTL